MRATNILWDIDDELREEAELPKEIEIPEEMRDIDEISDYLSEETGFCHKGFELVECCKSVVDWATVPVDTLIRVQDSGGSMLRYFARYENGKIYAWGGGRTSKTAVGKFRKEDDVFEWEFAEIVREG